MLRTVDQVIIKVLQEGYNKLWDYTGITKGMIKIFIQSILLLFIFMAHSFDLFTLLIIALGIRTIYVQFKHHDDQVKGRFAKINKVAEEEQSNSLWLWFRLPAGFFVFTLLVSLSNTLSLQVLCLFFVAVSFMLLFFYMECLYVRDREPPGRFNYAPGSV